MTEQAKLSFVGTVEDKLCGQSCPHTVPKASRAQLQANMCGPPMRTPLGTSAGSLPCSCATAFIGTLTCKGACTLTHNRTRNVHCNFAWVFSRKKGTKIATIIYQSVAHLCRTQDYNIACYDYRAGPEGHLCNIESS